MKEAKKTEPGGAVNSSNLRATLENSVIFACFESIFSLGEYLLVLLLITTGANYLTKGSDHTIQVFKQCHADIHTREGLDAAFGVLVQQILCIVTQDLSAIFVHIGVVAVSTSIVFCWMGWRCFAPFNQAWRFLPRWLGLKSPRISAIGAAVLLTDLLTFFILLWVQHSNDRWFMSFDNYIAHDAPAGERYIKYSRVASILFADPAKEELVFRGCIFYLIFKRCKEPFTSIAMSSALFGAFHLVNLVGAHFSTLYVLLQVLLGFEIGSFFGLRFLVTGSIWEPLILHIVNNIFSGFLPVKEAVVLQEPAVFWTLLFTVVIYAVLNALSVAELKQKIRTLKHKQK